MSDNTFQSFKYLKQEPNKIHWRTFTVTTQTMHMLLIRITGNKQQPEMMSYI